MRVRYTRGNLQIEFDAEGPRLAFERLAAVQELFCEPDCGCCKSTDLICTTRDWKDSTIYNLKCVACGAQLDLGQRQADHGLFIKRRDKDKNLLPNRGWYIWTRPESGAPAADSPPPPVRDDRDIPF
jgi:hypothetical protein